MSSQTIVLKVGMSCQGCVGAVNRVLGKMEGIYSCRVESFDIDLKEQKVTVKGNVQPEAVLQTVSKTGKKTAFWEDEAPVVPAVPENNPSEDATAASTEPETKPSETAAVAIGEPENKISETATVI